jgi:hypothetical protein
VCNFDPAIGADKFKAPGFTVRVLRRRGARRFFDFFITPSFGDTSEVSNQSTYRIVQQNVPSGTLWKSSARRR